MTARRPHLTVLRQAVAEDDDDYRYDPPFWLGIMVALILGVLMFGVVYGAGLLGHWAYTALRVAL